MTGITVFCQKKAIINKDVENVKIFKEMAEGQTGGNTNSGHEIHGSLVARLPQSLPETKISEHQ